ncbi:MAG: hypothetical protein QM504_08055 [Pseudomonadota bacterium]
MTVILYLHEKRELHADSLSTGDGVVVSRKEKKIISITDDKNVKWYIGVAGVTSTIDALRRYFDGKNVKKRLISMKESGIIINENNAFFICTKKKAFIGYADLTFDTLDYDYSIGSGRNLAMAAIKCGKSGVDAIKVAINMSVYCGGKVRSVKL